MKAGRPRKLTDADEDQILDATITRKMHTEKSLCARYHVSRTALRMALRRARARKIIKEGIA